MKRYELEQYEDEQGYLVATGLTEAPDGDWVRYEAAVAAVHDERSFALSEAERAAAAQAAAKASHAELEELRARVTKALELLEGDPGTEAYVWEAKEALRGRR